MAVEIDKRVPYARVEGFTHAEIQGVLATTQGNPFKEGHIPEFSVVRARRGKSKKSSNLSEVTKYHKRSFNFGPGTVWEDQNGNFFFCINLKGNNCFEQGLFASSSAPSGYLPYGLQEGDALLRILKASEILRTNNVDTEAIIKVIEPAELLIGKEKVSQDEYKARLIRSLWEQNAQSSGFDSKTGYQKIPRSELPKVSLALDNMIFFITVRGLQVPERIIDIYQARTEGDLLHILDKAFTFVNMEEDVRAKREHGYIAQHFSTENPDDVKNYLLKYLPNRLGKNFARMHKAGLVQGLAHYGNVSTTGSIYDLDTVRGEPLGLGDAPINYLDIINDLGELTDEIVNKSSGPLKKISKKFGGEFSTQFLNDYLSQIGAKDRNLKDVFGFTYDIDPYFYASVLMIEASAFIDTLVAAGYLKKMDPDKEVSAMQDSFEKGIAGVIYNSICLDFKKFKPNPSSGMIIVDVHDLLVVNVFARIFANETMKDTHEKIRSELSSDRALLSRKIIQESKLPYKDTDLAMRFFEWILADLKLDKKIKHISSSHNVKDFFEKMGLGEIFEQSKTTHLKSWEKDANEIEEEASKEAAVV